MTMNFAEFDRQLTDEEKIERGDIAFRILNDPEIMSFIDETRYHFMQQVFSCEPGSVASADFHRLARSVDQFKGFLAFYAETAENLRNEDEFE